MRRIPFALTLFVLVALLIPQAIAQAPLAPNTERVHFHRFDNNYAGWTVYAFGDTTEDTGNWSGGPVQAAGTDDFGAYFDVGLTSTAQDLGFIVHSGNAKDPGPDMHVNPQVAREVWVVSGTNTVYTAKPVIAAPGPVAPGKARVHYHRFDNTFTGWTLYAFGGTTENQSDFGDGPLQPAGIDAFGAYYDIGVSSGATDIGFILHFGNIKDPTSDLHLNPQSNNEVWVISGNSTVYTSLPTVAAPGPVTAAVERIHYHRPDALYGGWTVYSWGNTTANTGDWSDGPIQPAGMDSYGVFFDVPLTPNATDIGFIIHSGDTKDPGPDMHVNPSAQGHEIWVVSGSTSIFNSEPTAAQLLTGELGKLQAIWIDRNTIVLPKSQVNASANYFLSADLNAALQLSTAGVSGGTAYPLIADPAGLSSAQLARFPQLKGYAAFHPQFPDATTAAKILKGELVVSGLNAAGQLLYVTQVQSFGVLDDLFYYNGPLGVTFSAGTPTISVWAPTAQNVRLQLFDSASQTAPTSTVAMTSTNGVWSITGTPAWKNKYFLFDVNVYLPSTQAIVENLVTDPYSVGLSLNSVKSQIVDLDAPENKPAGWDQHKSPALNSLNDLSIYELHIRDFSANDATVPAEQRGTYLAFTNPTTAGMQHLHNLATAGLKAIHLLPSFDIASVNEDKSTWKTTGDLSGFAPDSDQQQAAVAAIQNTDGFNWGYDPLHFLAPEGSYAVNPDNRIAEYRQMVMGLHRAGLRVVQDEVFNHTSAAGEDPKSVLDQVVPNYYYRLTPDGQIYNGSCCADTATEHLMMEKLMKDALLMWATEYKIDGFRFDIMSFHSVATMNRVQQALRQLTPSQNGVDGSKIYLYGEGFNFGEVANNAFGPNASQVNLYGYGIGTFNDRYRDGVRGGNPFGDLREQGFATGLFTDPNPSFSSGNPSSQLSQLLHEEDWIRVGLTGNLRDFSFTDSTGNVTTGGKVDYNGQPTGYTASPIEAINYASVHDNQSLFDAVQMKSSTNDTIAERVRRQNLAMSLVALGQGIPFFQAGDDLLRSKSLDQNSYNSGDWFNRLDFTYQSDNWGVGLPMKSDNSANWAIEQPLLANGALKPGPAEIASSHDWFQTLLRIRNSSTLFRMTNAAQIQQHLQFLNSGASQVPGLIVMKLDAGNDMATEPLRRIVVVFNATTQQQSFNNAALQNLKLRLHPELLNSTDTVAQQSTYSADGTVTVPPLTTAVFVSSARQ